MARKIPFFVAELELGLGASVQTIYVSDTGYCRRTTDAGGVVPYPARLGRGFTLDMALDLNPTTDQTAWGYGAAEIANGDGRYNSLISAGWTPDGHPMAILMGEKTVEWQGDVLNNRTSATSNTHIGYDGVMVGDSLAGTVRQDYGAVISADPNSTNWVRNSQMTGAVIGTIGSGGVAPTNWSITAGGLTVQIISVTPTNVGGGRGNVIRIRFSGTATGTFWAILYNNAGGLCGLGFDQYVTMSVYVALADGTLPQGMQHWHTMADVAGTSVLDTRVGFGTVDATLSQYWRAMIAPSTGLPPFRATGNQGFYSNMTVGSTYDFTLDVALPQIEWGAVPTAYIPTSAGEATAGPGNTNLVRNSGTTGAVTGTPGTLPTNWSIPAAAGLSQQIVALGTETTTGYPYVDLRLFGTAVGTALTLVFEPVATIDCAQNDLHCLSAYVHIQAGTQTGLTFQLALRTHDATPAILVTTTEVAGALNPSTQAARSLRYVAYTAAGATTRWISPMLFVNFANGAAIDITMRIFGVSLIGGLVPQALIPTTTVRATRAPTFTSNGQSPPVINEAATTQYVRTTHVWGAGDATIATSTEVPALMAGQTVRKHVKTATGSSFGFFTVSGLPSTGMNLRGSIYVWVPQSFAATNRTMDVRLEGAGVTAGGSDPGAQAVDLTLRGQWQRVTLTAALAAASTACNITPRVFGTVAGDYVYTTCMQLEEDLGGPPTSYIPIGAAPVVRGADSIYMPRYIAVDPPYASLQPVLRAVAGPWQVNDDSLTVPMRDASYWMERPIKRINYLGTGMGGTGVYNGSAAVKDLPKPLLFGGDTVQVLAVRNIAPTLIDEVRLIWQYNNGPGSIGTIFEGGYNGFTYQGNVAFLTDLTTGTTNPGSYRTDNANGCFQLGSSPVGQITCDAYGLYSADPTKLEEWAYYFLLNLCEVPVSFISDTTPAGPHSLAIIDATGTRPTNVDLGLYLDSSQDYTGTQLLTALINAFSMWLVPRRDGTLALLRLANLIGTEPFVADLGVNNARIQRMALPTGIDPPWKRVRVNSYKNWTVQTSGSLAAASAGQRQFMTSQGIINETASPIAADILRPNDPAVIGVSPIGINTVALRSNLIGLFGNRRELWQVEVPYTVGTGLDWGSIVRLTYPVSSLAAGRRGQVIGFARTSTPTVTLRVLT